MVVGTATVLASGCAGSSNQGVTRDPAWVIIEDAEAPPRVMNVVPTGVRLRLALDDSISLPAPPVPLDSRGRFYTATYNPGEIALWAPDGSYVRTIGRRGDGPGEMRGTVIGVVGPGDTLHAPGGSVWSVFDSAGTFVRCLQNDPGHPIYVHALPDNTLLSTFAPVVSGDARYF
ncbi:MAG TPA: hypothetical protein VNZ57_11425 [Longimicrobiales bacterium]|nr:hypothetical protein [Longimicrobiales bacterium]